MNRKLHELTDDELEQVSGGGLPDYFEPVGELPVVGFVPHTARIT